MTISLIDHVLEMLNLFHKKSFSQNMSPTNFFEGKTILDLQQNCAPCRRYTQVWIGTKNNMTLRAVPRITLRASK